MQEGNLVSIWPPRSDAREHKTIAESFAALDSVAIEMSQLGVPGDVIELVVVDEHGQVVPRPGTH